MSSQTYLTENPPMILDATCSYARIWPKYATVRIDKRPECSPDVVMDNTDLKFPDYTFDIIYFDPPHVISHNSPAVWEAGMKRMNQARKKHAKTPGFFERYGVWMNRREWLSNVAGVNREFYRCLKPNGTLKVKLADAGTNDTVHLQEFLDEMTNFNLESQRTTKSKTKRGLSTVHWLTMKPKEFQP